MSKFAFTLTLGLLGAGVATPAVASDNWALQVIEDARSAERRVGRANVRVASLGATDIDTSESSSRSRRSSSTTAPEDRPQTRKTRVASLGTSKSDAQPERAERKSLSGGSVNWIADRGCLNGSLRGVVGSIASNFGPVTVNSTCRSKSHNARVGGASKSYHLDGDAVDFRIHSNVSAAYASLKSNGSVGGLKHYGGGLFHIDTGPRRSW